MGGFQIIHDTLDEIMDGIGMLMSLKEPGLKSVVTTRPCGLVICLLLLQLSFLAFPSIVESVSSS